MRIPFFVIGSAVVLGLAGWGLYWPPAFYSFVVVGPLFALGLYDALQQRRAILRNFPLIGHFRYVFEAIRPEINQYFVESDVDGRPFNRMERSVVYQRSKQELDTLPFGTRYDLYETGREWINHSLVPKHLEHEHPKVLVGEGRCAEPYALSIFNISAMSYGSLSRQAVEALNAGAKRGDFAHNTGEGGVSPYHLDPGGDLIWQIGTGYFGCRSAEGGFDPGRFQETCSAPSIRMIEVKLSQGAKPGHGGILPAKKVTPEIAKIRGVEVGVDVLSPPAHRAFSTPIELCEFVSKLRELSGRPVGIKLCVGKRREFLSICKAMVETEQPIDYIAVDGAEGGTGAAPLEFSNSVGCPLTEGLIFVHNALLGFGLREKVRVIASGKLITGFSLARVLAIGADAGYSARGMMLALGCIQALRCNNNSCPTGIATHDPNLTVGLVAPIKADRVYNYHRETVESVVELVGAAGLSSPSQLQPWHIMRRVDHNRIRHYGELYRYLEPGSLLEQPIDVDYERAWQRASASSF